MSRKSKLTIHVCYILSYKTPDYTRTATLITALKSLPNVELTIIKNKNIGALRYWQTFAQLVSYRLHHKPDVFILGFRGQEVFGLFYPFMRGSRIIFDEFINLHDWFVNEHHKLHEDSLASKLMDAYMRWVIHRCTYVLADTPAHARLSAEMYGTTTSKIVAIPVGAEENVFEPRKNSGKHKAFEVFFYGNMLPLHGMPVILDAIKVLADTRRIDGLHFTLVGGKGKPEMMSLVEMFIAKNDLHEHVAYFPWVEYEKLPTFIANADVCLGGPFGGTGQARRVVTGKTYQFMAMAKPVVIGETENDELFTNKKNCLISEQNNPAALADTLVWCHDHPQQLPAIGQNARKLYDTFFSSSSIANKLNPLLS